MVQIGFYSCSWTYIDQFLELQTAKRTFGTLYSAIFLGMAVSGTILSVCDNAARIAGVLCLLLVSLSGCLFLIQYIHRNVPALVDDFQEFAVLKTKAREIIRSIASSPFTVMLLCFCILLHTLLVASECEYMAGLQSFFQGRGENELSHFLGRLYLFGAIFNIFFGIFLYGRMIKKAGLNNMILIVPLFFTSLFLGWRFSNHLILPIMGFIAVEGALSLVEDNNFTLLLNAVPLNLKNKIRVVIESLIEPAGVLISSLLLMLFCKHTKALGLIMSLVFLAVGLMLRAYYAKGIFYNLISHVVNFHHANLSKKDYNQSKYRLLNRLENLKPCEQILLVECSLKFDDTSFLIQLLAKGLLLSKHTQLKFFQLLEKASAMTTEKLLPHLRVWIKEYPNLEKHLHLHLAKIKLLAPEDFTKTPSSCPYVKASHLISICHSLKGSQEAKYAQQEIVHMLLSKDNEKALVAIQATHKDLDYNFTPHLIDLLDSNPSLKKPVLEALVENITAENKSYLNSLLDLLHQSDHHGEHHLIIQSLEPLVDADNLASILQSGSLSMNADRRSLVQLILKLNEPLTEPLVKLLSNPFSPTKARLLAGEILAQKNHKKLKHTFHKMVSQEVQRAYLYHYHFITIQRSYPYSQLQMLEMALKNSSDAILDFLIQIQAFVQNFEKGEYLTLSLHSSNSKTHSRALESLQKMSTRNFYKMIQPLVENSDSKSFFKKYHLLKLPMLSLDELLDLLESSPSQANRLIVGALKERLNIQKIKLTPNAKAYPMEAIPT